MAKINDIQIMAEKESPEYASDVTEQPVESGISLTDHVRQRAKTLKISGFILGSDAAERRQRILDLWSKGEIVKYVGRNLFSGVIESFSTDHGYKTANGCGFTMSLVEIRIATPEYTSGLSFEVRTQVAKVADAGRKQPVEKGSGKGGKSIWEE
ncbi:hypothetical protein E0485_15205 [Paenibacillus albiflavus]|uniref:Dit-like phage tail protein N-terminal domain-containing protein n=1 Tax=Paenibacillus albiflavus TaxID=2545760 RepID=A0A4V2WNP0_9BACL|nr:hypothetical protein [Paenibacillus albiflavus]TCZ76182.1 hypothetical protein E0485_15205 [Paenibacillus albiflavus]